MEEFLIQAAQLVTALALLVVIHEFGHYLFARVFGIKVEKFYLFFNPWFSLVKWKPKPARKPRLDKHGQPKATWRDTEYGIGWLPLGGYCKIAGMIDESMDKEQMARPAESWEFRSKPAYQRLLVMLGGVLFNFLLAIVIYAGVALYYGEQYTPLSAVAEGFDFNTTAQEAGFRNGDRPYAIDGKPIADDDGAFILHMLEGRTVTVIRDKRDTVDIALPDNFLVKAGQSKDFIAARVPAVIDKVVNGEPADEAGLAEGDRIVAVGNAATPSTTELFTTLKGRERQATTVTVVRDGRRLTLPVTLNEYGKLGIQLAPGSKVYPTVTRRYNVLQAVPKGISDGTNMLTGYAGSMKYVFTKEGAESIGGFGALGGMFPPRWHWLTFWQITAFLSVILAFMNFLPIPALDGGHIMFLLWEVVTRRRVNEKVYEVAQYVGMAFLLLLLVYANGNDIIRAFR